MSLIPVSLSLILILGMSERQPLKLVSAVWGGIVGQPYAQELVSQRPDASFDVSLRKGRLPAALQLTRQGRLEGTPAEAGEYPFTVQVQTRTGQRIERSYLLIISGDSQEFGASLNGPHTQGQTLHSCQRDALQDNTAYVLARDVKAASQADICFRLGRGSILDLGGRTVTGRVVALTDPSGTELKGGSVACDWPDQGADAGCVRVTSEAMVTAPLRIHDVKLENSAQVARALHIEWSVNQPQTSPSIRLSGITAVVPAQPEASRSYALSIVGHGQFVVLDSSDLTCAARARACQAVMCYGVLSCKVHHTRITMEQNATDENGRAILFDGGVQYGEAWNNTIAAHNNRAVRIRDSRNIRIHDNAIGPITPGQGALAAIHLGDPDAGINDLSSSIDHNHFASTGGRIVFARSATNVQFAQNIVDCTGGCSPGSLADLRGPTESDIIFKENQLAGFTAPELVLGPGTKARLCRSGAAMGPGKAVYTCR